MIPILPTGTFLTITFSLVGVLIALEAWAFYQRRRITISELSRIHPYLRGLILLGILLFGGWWSLHSLPDAMRHVLGIAA